MENTSVNKSENRQTQRLCLGLLAHVDAGKTTLAESLLYLSGQIRKLGRVDHKDAFLDTYELERARGITIFSKQAEMMLKKRSITLLDTPGHADFSAEMERTLQVLDYAVLVISGADGVQGHVQTLWRLLRRYRVPVFLFINKMDQDGTDHSKLMAELKERLDERCTDFSPDRDAQELAEELAMCDEELLEQYVDGRQITDSDIQTLVRKRKLFPCWFGSALKLQGVDIFMDGLDRLMQTPHRGREFGAKVYKIGRDPQGTRLTYMKITGGCLKVKMPLQGTAKGEIWEEKADQIRIYSGAGYETVSEAVAGTICAVTGLTQTYAGEGLGAQKQSGMPLLEPVLMYQILLPEGCDARQMYRKLCQLEEEEPQLHMVWNEELEEIHVQVMGEVQTEILRHLIRERFGTEVQFGTGSIVYKETIQEPVEGIGHFEPLRHYAEVHLILEPGEPGSGIQTDSICSEDMLDRNWQRLILTHIKEKAHRGVLTGAEITDMKITLAAGRAHQKHTEGGDFRQATYRAIRQGLRKAQSVLLEPVYEFRLEVPSENIGRGMADIQKMSGKFSQPEQNGDFSVLTGTVPAACAGNYAAEVAAYTKGRGKFFCSLKGYEPCHNAQEVIEAAAYDPETDKDNPTGSVFCAHGAGFVVPWDEVENYMHVPAVLKNDREEQPQEPVAAPDRTAVRSVTDPYQNEKELQEIFERTYGPVQRKHNAFRKKTVTGTQPVRTSAPKKTYEKEYLLVDGYNIIFAWDDLKELSRVSLEGARGKLADLLCNYQGYKNCTVILVFDAYKVPGSQGTVQKYHNIYIVYTKEAETADQYIEKTVHEIGRKYEVTVATSDALEQVIIMGQGGKRISAKGFRQEMEAVCQEIRQEYLIPQKSASGGLFDGMSEDLASLMEEIRLGRKSFGNADDTQEEKDG